MPPASVPIVGLQISVQVVLADGTSYLAATPNLCGVTGPLPLLPAQVLAAKAAAHAVRHAASSGPSVVFQELSADPADVAGLFNADKDPLPGQAPPAVFGQDDGSTWEKGETDEDLYNRLARRHLRRLYGSEDAG